MPRRKEISSSKELTFIVSAALILVLIAAGTAYLLNFLILNINKALSTAEIRPAPVAEFNIEKFQKLNLPY